MEEKTSECRTGALPGREGLPKAQASLLRAQEWSLVLAPSETAAQGGQSQGTITQSRDFQARREPSACMWTLEGVKSPPRTRGLTRIAILRVHREPSSTPGTAMCPAPHDQPHDQLLPGHEQRRSMGVTQILVFL